MPDDIGWSTEAPRSGRRPGEVHILTDAATGKLDGESLLQYVICARVDLLAECSVDAADRRWLPLASTKKLSRNQMALEIGLTKNELWKLCSPQAHHPREVADLEARLVAFAHHERNLPASVVRTLGWLSAFAAEVTPRHDHDPAAAQLGRWFSDLAERGPVGSAETIVLGEALLGRLSGANPKAAEVLWQHNLEQAELTARSLVAVATRPPGGGATAAAQLAARLGHRVLPCVQRHLVGSPVGFRAMRVVQRMFEIAARPPAWWSSETIGSGADRREVRAGREIAEARRILRMVRDRTEPLPDPYPGRALYLEAVRSSLDTPTDSRDEAWRAEALDMVMRRMSDRSRPGRERAYAAHCLWEFDALPANLRTAVAPADRWGLVADLLARAERGRLNDLLLDRVALGRLDRGEVALVERVLATQSVVPDKPVHRGAMNRRATSSPDRTSGGSEQPHLGVIARLPQSIRAATADLIRIALLSPDGTSRGRACEALREALVTREAGSVVAEVVHDPDCPPWLCEVGAFVLGQLGNWSAAADLITLAGDRDGDPATRHAAVWALGDLRLADSDEVLELCERIVVESLSDPAQPVDVTAAAVYTLGVTDFTGEHNGLLRYLSSHSWASTPIGRSMPPYVPMLARWGLVTRERIVERRIGSGDRLIWGAGTDDLQLLHRGP